MVQECALATTPPGWKYRETERQRGRETERQTDRETDREIFFVSGGFHPMLRGCADSPWFRRSGSKGLICAEFIDPSFF